MWCVHVWLIIELILWIKPNDCVPIRWYKKIDFSISLRKSNQANNSRPSHTKMRSDIWWGPKTLSENMVRQTCSACVYVGAFVRCELFFFSFTWAQHSIASYIIRKVKLISKPKRKKCDVMKMKRSVHPRKKNLIMNRQSVFLTRTSTIFTKMVPFHRSSNVPTVWGNDAKPKNVADFGFSIHINIQYFVANWFALARSRIVRASCSCMYLFIDRMTVASF